MLPSQQTIYAYYIDRAAIDRATYWHEQNCRDGTCVRVKDSPDRLPVALVLHKHVLFYGLLYCEDRVCRNNENHREDLGASCRQGHASIAEAKVADEAHSVHHPRRDVPIDRAGEADGDELRTYVPQLIRGSERPLQSGEWSCARQGRSSVPVWPLCRARKPQARSVRVSRTALEVVAARSSGHGQGRWL
eukprot:COSAG02_NODE_2001_length_10139_cov_15.596116_8_plen_190_part_00